jgi:hypothetical protein
MADILKTEWPSLPLNEWQETQEALHLWTQIIGKIQLKLTPMTNHWWNIALRITSYGISTGLIHYKSGCFQIDLDFIRHKLYIRVENGKTASMDLKSRSVADFYEELMQQLKSLDIKVKIWTQPVEMEYKVHFEKDEHIREYKPEYVNRFWTILLETDKVMRKLRSGYLGKVSPVNFFWGSFDVALTFFSGRPAPEHPGTANIGKQVMVEAYSHELCSMGFWPGAGFGEPAFYAYAYPAPEGYSQWKMQPENKAFFLEAMGEFVLPYEAVRKSDDPQAVLFSFFSSSLEAASSMGKWDKALFRTDI